MQNRAATKEQLDDLSLQGEQLYKALQSLNWINRWFGNKRSSCKAIAALCKKENRPLHIIDLGCGGGDMMLSIAKKLDKDKAAFSITGIDGNRNSLAYAEKKCIAFGKINFRQADILNDAFTTGPCDLLFSSHFVYHFTEEGLVNFLKKNLPLVSSAVVFSELERNRFALLLFRLVSSLLPVSKMARQDGELAIKRSFTKEEWLSILKKAGICSFRLKRVPFFRIQLIILPPYNN
jgi:2-polyprenyl-3-methyl-5-hydroxy-6-metoxy-1,4-benzoquinol methylase